MSVLWGVKSIANLSRYNAQRDKSLGCCRQRARSVGRSYVVNSTTRAQKLTAPSAISHDLPVTLGTTLLSLVRSRVVHSTSGAAARSSIPLHRNFSFYPNNQTNPFLELLTNTIPKCNA